MSACQRIGGAKGIRTPDLLNAIQTLSQLSYSPTPEAEYSARAVVPTRAPTAAASAGAGDACRPWRAPLSPSRTATIAAMSFYLLIRGGTLVDGTGAPGRRADVGVTGARVLGRYVPERRVLPLETAIAKLTSVPAERLGLADRGVVREGLFADLVLLDPTSVLDTATFERPAAPGRHRAGDRERRPRGVRRRGERRPSRTTPAQLIAG